MKSLKRSIAEVIAKNCFKTAVKAEGKASAYGFCQPEEPKELKTLRQKNS